MTVHINQFSTGAPVGPGLPLSLDSDIGTFPTGGSWNITFALSSGGVSPFAQFKVPDAFNFQQVFPWTHQSGMTQTAVSIQNYEDGQSIHLQVALQDSSGTQVDVNDSTQTQTYQSQLGLAQQALDLASTSGGLTSDQATQLANADTQSAQMLTNWSDYTSVTLPSLQDVLNSVLSGITTTLTSAAGAVPATLSQLFSWISLDKLTLADITGGETCDPVDATLGGSFTGVIVRATTIPDTYPFTAPGDTWTPLDLAVIEFVRGSDVLKRIGMHTTTHMEYPLPGLITIPATEIPIDLLPPDYHLKIWWGNGVCGQAFGMVLP